MQNTRGILTEYVPSIEIGRAEFEQAWKDLTPEEFGSAYYMVPERQISYTEFKKAKKQFPADEFEQFYEKRYDKSKGISEFFAKDEQFFKIAVPHKDEIPNCLLMGLLTEIKKLQAEQVKSTSFLGSIKSMVVFFVVILILNLIFSLIAIF